MVSGEFNTFNGVSTPKLVMLNANGSIDTNFKVKAFNEGGTSKFALQLEDGLIAVSGYFLTYNGISRTNFMIIDAKGDLVSGMNNTGMVGGLISRMYETRSDDGKRALLLLGDFYKFDNIDTRGITRITIE